MLDFRKILSHCNLHDLGFTGPPWTFDNRPKDKRNVRARLDRAVASHCWSDLFPETKVTHVISSRSDHLPILIEFEKQPNYPKSKELPKYEYMWERDANLPAVIEDVWTSLLPCASLSDIQMKLSNTRRHLSNWSQEHFGNVTKQIQSKKALIAEIWEKPRTADREEILSKVYTELDELLHREEMMWRQRLRVN
jgi:hypothetical protein